MKSFKQFLREEEEEKKGISLLSVPVRTVKPSVPTVYSDPSTGVKSFFHSYDSSPLPISSNTPKNTAYWGYGVADSTGSVADTPQTGLSSTEKSQISRAARGHMEDFIKTHPEVEKITYQTNPDAQGALNRKYFKDTMWPEMQTKTGTKASFKEVSSNPLKRSPLTAGAGSIGPQLVGNLVGEYIIKPAAEKAGVFDAVEKSSRAAFSRMPDWAVDVADKSLGAAQVALDPLSAMQKPMEQGIENEAEELVKRAGSPSKVRFTGKSKI